MEKNSRLASFRAGNYASAILDLDSLKDTLSGATIGVPYYFGINMANGSSKVFYYLLEKMDEEGATMATFYRDFTKYNPSDYGYQEDYMIKGFASPTVLDEEITNPAIEKINGSAPKSEMIKYVEVFLDAVQVMTSMPF